MCNYKEDEVTTMNKSTMYVGAQEVMEDWGVSKPKAYVMIRELNEQLKTEYPKAIIVAGKINRRYYEEACLVWRQ